MKKTNKSKTKLSSCNEVEIHYKRPLFDSMPKISSAKDVDSILRDFVNFKQIDLRECFWVLLMTPANRVLGIAEVASGDTAGVVLNQKYIFQLAILTNCSALVLAHYAKLCIMLTIIRVEISNSLNLILHRLKESND